MTFTKRAVRLYGLATMLVCSTLHAQPKVAYEENAVVFRNMIELKVSPPYLMTPWPNPPVAGFFAWKISFGNDSLSTVVFRTDSAVTVKNTGEALRASNFYRCPSSSSVILDCVDKLKGSVRSVFGGGALVVQITDSAFVRRVREVGARVYVRELIEPGGRFHIDHIGVTYR